MNLTLGDIPDLLPKEKWGQNTAERVIYIKYIRGYNKALADISQIPLSKILSWCIEKGLVEVDREKVAKIFYDTHKKIFERTHYPASGEDIAVALADMEVIKIKE